MSLIILIVLHTIIKLTSKIVNFATRSIAHHAGLYKQSIMIQDANTSLNKLEYSGHGQIIKYHT